MLAARAHHLISLPMDSLDRPAQLKTMNVQSFDHRRSHGRLAHRPVEHHRAYSVSCMPAGCCSLASLTVWLRIAGFLLAVPLAILHAMSIVGTFEEPT